LKELLNSVTLEEMFAGVELFGTAVSQTTETEHILMRVIEECL
jgi:hypothetical protein